MRTVSAILTRKEPWGTLPTFAHLLTRGPMARQHITLSGQMQAEVDDICERFCMTRSKFLTRGVQLAIDDARKRFVEASNDPSVTAEVVALPQPPATATVAPSDGPTQTIKRGETHWFELSGVCRALGVEYSSLMGEIDPADDVLSYVGKEWIDERGIAEARALCRDTEASEVFGAWAQTKTNA